LTAALFYALANSLSQYGISMADGFGDLRRHCIFPNFALGGFLTFSPQAGLIAAQLKRDREAR